MEEDKESDASGKLVVWDEDDAENPQSWSTGKRYAILTIISTGSLCVTCASSVVTSAFKGIERDLHASQEVAILGLSFFVVGLGLGPMLLAPFSEFYGRKPVYSMAFLAFFLLGLPVAFANNKAVFFIFRFLTGFAGSAFLSVSGGSVSDLWKPHEAFFPMAFYTCSPFAGPVLGPVFAGFINQYSDWRWSFWVISIWSFVYLIILVLFVPETFHPVLLSKRARQLRNRTGDSSYYAKHERMLEGRSLRGTILASSTRVAKLLMLEPMLLLLCIWCAILLGILYLFFELFPAVFAKHNFQEYQVGLSFLGIGIGNFLALATMPFFIRRYHARMADPSRAGPEARLDLGKVGALLAPAALFTFAFTTYAHVHWIAPIIASVFFGSSIIYVYTSVFTYSATVWQPLAASAMGANSALRSAFAAGFPLFANPMQRTLGTVGTAALLAGLTCLIAPLPFLFDRYGPQLRAKSRFTL